jgi:hypothetical protein
MPRYGRVYRVQRIEHSDGTARSHRVPCSGNDQHDSNRPVFKAVIPDRGEHGTRLHSETRHETNTGFSPRTRDTTVLANTVTTLLVFGVNSGIWFEIIGPSIG